MRVLNYLELEGPLQASGIGTSVRHQRAALADADLDLLTSPYAGGSLGSGLRRLVGGDRLFADYDVAHCNFVGPQSLAVARHAKRAGRPLVLHAHMTREDFGESFRFSDRVAPVLGAYLKRFYSQADLVLCPSEYTKGVLADYPVDAPVRTITNGVDADRLAGYGDLRDEYRERYDLDGLVVFSVGNVFERKGLTTFCETAARTEFDFAWFGRYETGPQASAEVRRWVGDPPENVTFTGWVDDIRGAYGAGDVYLFPAKDENQGIAVLEAMACGKPVVLRDIPVFREFYEDGHDCLFCETTADFSAALRRLGDDPHLRRRLSENARATAAEHSLDRVADELQSAYRDAARFANAPAEVARD